MEISIWKYWLLLKVEAKVSALEGKYEILSAKVMNLNFCVGIGL